MKETEQGYMEGAGIEVVVLPEEEGVMIKEIIYGRLALSRGLLRRMKSGGGLLLNGEPAYITQRVRAKDVIAISFFDAATQVEAQELPLDILFEDENLLVVNKPAGLPVHPTRTYPEGTLVNGLAFHWDQKGYQRKVRLLHRLDRETSGVLLVAKEPYSYRNLAEQLRKKELRRTYLAFTKGNLYPEQGTIDAPIGRPEITGGHSLQRGVVPHGKIAITEYEVVEHCPLGSLVRLMLVTGRTHQIRVHLRFIGYPVLGDEIYGELSPYIGRHALHACSLEFAHPRTGAKLEIEAPLPEDMKSLMNLGG